MGDYEGTRAAGSEQRFEKTSRHDREAGENQSAHLRIGEVEQGSWGAGKIVARGWYSVSFLELQMNVNSPWLKGYLRVTGSIAAAVGVLDRYSKEHRAFLSSGFICQNCKRTLLSKYFVADVRC